MRAERFGYTMTLVGGSTGNTSLTGVGTMSCILSWKGTGDGAMHGVPLVVMSGPPVTYPLLVSSAVKSMSISDCLPVTWTPRSSCRTARRSASARST